MTPAGDPASPPPCTQVGIVAAKDFHYSAGVTSNDVDAGFRLVQ